MTPLATARLIALLAPLLLLSGALGSEYIGGLYPCEMCHWQRWPHEAAILFALLAMATAKGKVSLPLLILAALAIATSGAIGVFHAGVEYGWWEGITGCAAGGLRGASGADILADIMATPLVRCDQPQWELFGISLAGFNALFSFAAAIAIFWLIGKSRKATA